MFVVVVECIVVVRCWSLFVACAIAAIVAGVCCFGLLCSLFGVVVCCC